MHHPEAISDHRGALKLGSLFFLLALWLAWFVTPHGDIPDESGHYAYVQEIAEHGTLPLLGRSLMARDIWRDIDGLQGKTRPNYIAQHPPLYYAVAAVPYRVLQALTDRKDLLPGAPRLVSALSLGVLVFLLVLSLRQAGVSLGSSMAGAAAVGLIPLVPHLSSGISNDVFLTMLSAGATLSLVRYVSGATLKHAYFCALWLAAAGATKMTAWVLIAACMAILLWELRKSGWSWVLHGAGLVLVALSTSLLWMARNAHHFGNPFHVYGADFKQKVFDTTHWDYLASQPFFDQLLGNLYASVGFSGYCQSPVNVSDLSRLCQGIRIMREDGLGVSVFAALSTLVLACLLVAVLRRVKAPAGEQSVPSGRPLSLQQRFHAAVGHGLNGQWVASACLVIAIAIAGTVGFMAHDPSGIAGWLRLAPALLLLAVAPFGVVLVVSSRSTSSRLMAYGALALLLMALLVFHMGYKSYLINGYPRGLQGRYLLPFLPLMMVSAGLAIQDMRCTRLLTTLLMTIMAGLFLHTYVGLVIPFFQSVRV